MKALINLILTFIVLFTLFLVSDVWATKRIALVIGNNTYPTSPLKNPVNDVNDMASVLRGLNFEIIKKTNATQRSMEDAIALFGKKLYSADIGLFFYAGHGMQIDGTNYLIPVDARCESAADVKYEAVHAERVLAQMQQAKNKLNIVILDACRNNPFRTFRSTQVGLAQMHAPKGSIVAYATAPGSVADDGGGRNGLFTSHLLQNFRKDGLTVQQIFQHTGLAVMRKSSDKQVPWVSYTPIPDFFLKEKGSGGTTLQPENATSSSESSSTIAMGSIPRCVKQDGRFCKLSNGMVLDTRTKLMWAPKDNGSHITWKDAKRYCWNYTGGGYDDWRMPTKDELAGLYDLGKSYTPAPNTVKVHLTRLIKLSSSSAWVAEKGIQGGGFFHFHYGNTLYYKSFSVYDRALPVRVSE